MVTMIFMRTSCGSREVGVGFGGSGGLVVGDAPAGGRSSPVSPHPAPARPTSAGSAAASSVRDMGVEGMFSGWLGCQGVSRTFVAVRWSIAW